jgi:hypothetical protein
VVGEAAFLDGDARTHAVRRAGGIEIDHGPSAKKKMVLRIAFSIQPSSGAALR